jgi:hypothetical protein
MIHFIDTRALTDTRMNRVKPRKPRIFKGSRGPEPIPRGTPMPGTLGMIVLKLLGD